MKIIKWLLWDRWWFIRQVKRVGGLSVLQVETLIDMNISDCKSSLFIINDMFRIAERYK